MITPTKTMPRHMRGVITRSPDGRGGCCMSPSSAGSTPSASAGAPSVTRLIHRICVASSGSTTASSVDVKAELPGEEHAKEHRHHLADVRRQQVAQELPDVGEDRAAFLDGGDDRREVVVGEHHVGRLFRHVGPGDAHRDADVGRLQRRRVVHAVAGHRHDRARAPQRVDDAQLVFGVHARVDRHLGDRARQRRRPAVASSSAPVMARPSAR